MLGLMVIYDCAGLSVHLNAHLHPLACGAGTSSGSSDEDSDEEESDGSDDEDSSSDGEELFGHQPANGQGASSSTPLAERMEIVHVEEREDGTRVTVTRSVLKTQAFPYQMRPANEGPNKHGEAGGLALA